MGVLSWRGVHKRDLAWSPEGGGEEWYEEEDKEKEANRSLGEWETSQYYIQNLFIFISEAFVKDRSKLECVDCDPGGSREDGRARIRRLSLGGQFPGSDKTRPRACQLGPQRHCLLFLPFPS